MDPPPGYTPASMTRPLLLALEACLLAVAGLVAWELAVTIAARFSYPYDLEWMEGATLLSAVRARDGLTLYGRPTLDYIPFIYPPLYAWIVGALGHVVPVGYPLGRAVSIAGSLLGASSLAYAARVAGARWAVSFACVALFFSTYDDCGSFFDLVRTDGLSIALLGWSLALSSRSGRGVPVAGLLLAVAFMAKHHAAMFGLPVALLVWRRDGRRAALVYGLCAAVPALLFTAGMQWYTRGFFLTWLLGVPATHGEVADRLFPWVEVLSWWPLRTKSGGALIELWKALPWTTTAAVLLPLWLRRTAAGVYWGVVTAVAIVTVSLMRGHTGGFLNVLIPGLWAFSLWPALLSVWAGERWRFAGHGIAVLMAAQLWLGRESLTHYEPTESDRASVASLVDELKALPEPLLIPHAPYAAVMAEKVPQFALICLWDIDHAGSPFRAGVRAVDKAIAAQHWAAIVLPADATFDHGLKKFYKLSGALHTKPFGMRTGWGVRLRQVWVPDPAKTKAPAADPAGDRAADAPDASPEASPSDPADLPPTE